MPFPGTRVSSESYNTILEKLNNENRIVLTKNIDE